MAATGKAEIRALMLRLPRDLHRLLAQEAKKAKPKRSLNADIVRRLRLSFDLEGELADAKRRLAEQDLLKLAQQHLDRAKKLQEGLVEIKDGLLKGAWIAPQKGSGK